MTERYDHLRAQAGEALNALVAPSAHCALVGFPISANVGDSAMWLGERAFLRRAGASLDYVCDEYSYSEKALAARLPSGTILIHAGGTLGDLWPTSQLFRERVIRAFPSHRIIQLPQSINFRTQANLDRARAVFDAHPGLTLMVRDRHSLDFASANFRAQTILCPDMAFGLTRLPRPCRPKHAIVWLGRDDHEGLHPPIASSNVHHVDWAAGQEAGRWRHHQQQMLRRVRHGLEASEANRRDAATNAALCRAFDGLARLELVRGCRILSRGRVVVTDRLHGHILSALLGLPHVVLADRYDKIGSFWATWARRAPSGASSATGWDRAQWADSAENALEVAELALSTGPSWNGSGGR